jgi:hypothetical protein
MPRRKEPKPGQPITFAEFRTGLTFADVRAMMWMNTDNAAEWKYKRRGTVLGYWRDLKLKMWDQYCAQNPDGVVQ